jgi:hypothetical protein
VAPPDARSAGDAAPQSSWACTQVMGPNVAGEWFAAGFENLVDGNKWQVKAPHASMVDYWANPTHAVWREAACDPSFSNCETKSACAGGVKPDRMVFVVQLDNYLGSSQKIWEDNITTAMNTIKTKYPTVKHFELMTFIRGANGADCGTETKVAANLDKAIAALAASPGAAVTAAPKFEAAMCNYFSGAPHMTATGNKAMADLIGKYYAKIP